MLSSPQLNKNIYTFEGMKANNAVAGTSLYCSIAYFLFVLKYVMYIYRGSRRGNVKILLKKFEKK